MCRKQLFLRQMLIIEKLTGRLGPLDICLLIYKFFFSKTSRLSLSSRVQQRVKKNIYQKKCFRLGLAGRLSLSPRVREIAISEIHDSTLNWNRALGAHREMCEYIQIFLFSTLKGMFDYMQVFHYSSL